MEAKLIKGRILKGIGGFYYIQGEDGDIYECKARGRFRKEGIKPIPGDKVIFTPPVQTQGGSIEEILPRKNSLPRPMIANIDLLMIVASAGKPEADLSLIDKLLLYAAYNHVPAAIVLNKIDTVEDAGTIPQEYSKCGAQILQISAKTGQGLDQLKELLRGKFTCLAGQSAVGKSTLLNAVAPSLGLETGGLSKKTDRGRHTTRHSELLELPGLDAVVADTPGFSILECMDIEPEQLREYYPEFAAVTGECRFDNCVHDREPQCAVKKSVAEGIIPEARYTRYLNLLQELIERREKRYV